LEFLGEVYEGCHHGDTEDTKVWQLDIESVHFSLSCQTFVSLCFCGDILL